MYSASYYFVVQFACMWHDGMHGQSMCMAPLCRVPHDCIGPLIESGWVRVCVGVTLGMFSCGDLLPQALSIQL